ncbi:MAG: hypothetical protein ACK4LQ_09425 [Pararhodobacter sp.]
MARLGFRVPMIAWLVVVLATFLTLIFIEPRGDGATRGFTLIWIGLWGFLVALGLALLAGRNARGQPGRAAQMARMLPWLMLLVLLWPLVQRFISF